MRPTQRGFTLLELLVATLVLALMATLGWRGLDGVTRSRDLARQRQAQTRQLRLTLEQLQADLDQSCDAGAGLPAVASAGGDLLVVRRSADAWQLVRWGVRQHQLRRWATPPTRQRAALLAARAAEPGAGLALLDGVTTMQLQAYQRGGSDWNPQPGAWVALAPAGDLTPSQVAAPAAALTTPPALRLTLGLDSPAFPGAVARDFLLENRG